MHTRHRTHGFTVQFYRKLLFLPCNRGFDGFRIMDCEAPDDGLIHRCHRIPFEDGLFKISIVSALHELVCVSCVFKKNNYDVVLWNPVTGEYKKLSETNPHMEYYFSKVKALGLFHNGTFDKEYKLLMVSTNDLIVHIYSLNSDSWEVVDLADNYRTLSQAGLKREMMSGTWLNGYLYFLKYGLILKFDTKMQRFTRIPIPLSLEDLDVRCLTMNVQEGFIYLGVKYETIQHQNYTKITRIQLWRMTADENWEKEGGPYRVDSSMYPYHWLGNKTWLMIESPDGRDPKGYLYKVDHNKNYTKGKNFIINGNTPIIGMNRVYEKVNYIESIMPIDGSI